MRETPSGVSFAYSPRLVSRAAYDLAAIEQLFQASGAVYILDWLLNDLVLYDGRQNPAAFVYIVNPNFLQFTTCNLSILCYNQSIKQELERIKK